MLALLATRNGEAVRQPVVDWQVDVEADRQVEVETLVSPALRRHRDAELFGFAGGADVDRLAFPHDVTGSLGIAPEDTHGELAAAGANQAIEAHDLAATHGDRDILEPFARKAAGLEQDLAERNGLFVVDLLDGPIDHQRHQLILGGVLDVARAHQSAVAQDGDAIGEVENLLEPMADVDDGDAAVAKPADERKKLRGFLPGEISGRLIKDQKLGTTQRSTGCRDQLLLADGEIAEHFAGGKVEAQVVEETLRLAIHFALAQQPVTDAFVAQKDVRCNRQVAAEHDFLVHRVDAVIDGFLRGVEQD